jgi:uncharacterized membrane protein YoaK (UPF0700 family)
MKNAEANARPIATPSVDGSLSMKLLLAVLSLIAGSADVIGFLGLGGLFIAHVTGNLVVLVAHLVTGGEVQTSRLLSVPVFVLALGLTRLVVAGLDRIGVASLRPLLLLQFLLLAGFLVLCVAPGARFDADGANGILGGMIGVSAMAVQNALVQVSLTGAPSTAVMTTNISHFMMDAGEALFGRDPGLVAMARSRAKHGWLVIVGFAAGCGIGAACEIAIGLWSLALPAGLALAALGIAWSMKRDPETR